MLADAELGFGTAALMLGGPRMGRDVPGLGRGAPRRGSAAERQKEVGAEGPGCADGWKGNCRGCTKALWRLEFYHRFDFLWKRRKHVRRACATRSLSKRRTAGGVRVQKDTRIGIDECWECLGSDYRWSLAGGWRDMSENAAKR